ncbi:molybdopterin converting factor subunit 1 [soil metagenome]
MSIQILFFGATADITGFRRQEVDVADGTAAAAVFDSVLNEHPRLAAQKLHFSVNQQFATGNELLEDGDELAIFTPVSGG